MMETKSTLYPAQHIVLHTLIIMYLPYFRAKVDLANQKLKEGRTYTCNNDTSKICTHHIMLSIAYLELPVARYWSVRASLSPAGTSALTLLLYSIFSVGVLDNLQHYHV